MSPRRQLLFALILALPVAAQQRGIFTGNQDLGGATGGSVAFDAGKGEYKVSGGGADVWGTSDDFQFVWKKVTGDVTLSADIRWEGTGFPRRKAMLMIRQSLEAGSPYVDAASHGNGLTSLQFRGKAGEQTYQVLTQIEGPVRLRIVRKATRFTVFAGRPGGEMKELGPLEFVTLGNDIYVGLGVCSHVAGTLDAAYFSNVKIEQNGQ